MSNSIILFEILEAFALINWPKNWHEKAACKNWPISKNWKRKKRARTLQPQFPLLSYTVYAFQTDHQPLVHYCVGDVRSLKRECQSTAVYCQLLYILKTVELNQLAYEFFRLYNLNQRALNQRIILIREHSHLNLSCLHLQQPKAHRTWKNMTIQSI